MIQKGSVKRSIKSSVKGFKEKMTRLRTRILGLGREENFRT